MKTFYRGLFVFVALSFVLAAQSQGSALLSTKTSAKINSDTVPSISMEFHLVKTDPIIDPVFITVDWQRAGGIIPCVKLVIPDSCFVVNEGLHVENFRSCGVELTYDLDDGRGANDLTLVAFEARIRTPRASDATHVSIEMTFTDLGREAQILDILGGAQVETTIDGEIFAIAFPTRVESETK